MLKEKSNNLIKKVLEIVNNKYYTISVFSIVFLIILYNFIFFVAKNSVNIPFEDQWYISDIIIDKFDLLKTLLYQHNEHRIGVGLLIIKILSRFSNWNQILEIKFISFLILSSLSLIFYVKYYIKKEISITDLIIPLLILNIYQWQNIIWGFQIPFLLPLLFLSIWIFLLIKTKGVKKYLLLSILSLLSTFSSLHGLILPLLTLILLIYEFLKLKIINLKYTLIFAITNICIFGLYFIDYTRNYQAELSFSLSKKLFNYLIYAVGSSFLLPSVNFILYLTLTVMTAGLFIYALIKIIKNNYKQESLLIGTLLISYSLIFILLTAIGRSSLGTEYALASRYVSFTILIPLGVYFILLTLKYGAIAKIILLVVLIYSSLFLTTPTQKNVERLSSIRRNALECYSQVSKENISQCFDSFPLSYSKTYQENKLIPVLKLKKINDFTN